MMNGGTIVSHLVELKVMTAETAARVQSLEGHVTQRLDALDVRANSQSDRIRAVEKASWTRGGAIAVVAGGFAYIVQFLMKGLTA